MPEMYVFAGCNGAGKSTLIEDFKGRFQTVINPDQIAKQLKPENPRAADLSAGKEAIRTIQNCIEQKETFAVETTLSGEFMIRQMKAAKNVDYQVYFYFIGLQDVQMHIERVQTRVKEGGHFVADEDILRRYDLSLSHLKAAVSLADISVIIDNSDEQHKTLIEIINHEVQHKEDLLPSWLKKLDF